MENWTYLKVRVILWYPSGFWFLVFALYDDVFKNGKPK